MAAGKADLISHGTKVKDVMKAKKSSLRKDGSTSEKVLEMIFPSWTNYEEKAAKP